MEAPAASEWFGVQLSADELRSRAAGGVALSTLARFVSQLIRFGSITLLARLLLPADFGLVAMIGAVIGLADSLKDMGLSAATIRFKNLSAAQASNLFWINVAIALALVALIAACAPLLESYYDEPRIGAIAVALSLGLVLNAVGVQHRALLRRVMRFDLTTRIGIAATFAGGIVSIIGACSALGYWALILGGWAGDLVSSVLAWRYCSWRPGLPRRFVGTGPVAAFGGRMFAYGAMGYLAINLHTLIIGRLWGASATGIYGRATSIQQFFLGWILEAPRQVMPSALSRAGDAAQLASFFYRSCTLTVIAALPAMFVGIVLPHELIRVAFGPQWDASAEIVRLLALGVVAQVICNTSGWVYASVGDAQRMMRWGFIGWGTMIAATVVGAQFAGTYGTKALALAASVSITLLTWPCMAYAFRGTSLTWGGLLQHLCKPLASGIVAGLGAWGVLMALPPDAMFPRLATGVGVFMLLYGALLFTVGGQRQLLLASMQALRQRRRSPTADAPNDAPG